MTFNKKNDSMIVDFSENDICFFLNSVILPKELFQPYERISFIKETITVKGLFYYYITNKS